MEMKKRGLQLKTSLLLSLMLSMIFIFAACGNGVGGEQENSNAGNNQAGVENDSNAGNNQGEVENDTNDLDGELPEIVATGSNMFTDPESIVTYFSDLHFVWEYQDDEFVDIIYEWQGEEEVEGVAADKVYVSIKYDDSFYDGYEYDFWFNAEGEVIQVFSYENDVMVDPTYTNLNERAEEVFDSILEPFEYFDMTYREALQDGFWSINETSIEDTKIGDVDVTVYTFSGKHDATFDPDAVFKVVLADFGDFEFSLDTEDTTAFGSNQSFEIKEMKLR